jgi:hypothetical protein
MSKALRWMVVAVLLLAARADAGEYMVFPGSAKFASDNTTCVKTADSGTTVSEDKIRCTDGGTNGVFYIPAFFPTSGANVWQFEVTGASANATGNGNCSWYISATAYPDVSGRDADNGTETNVLVPVTVASDGFKRWQIGEFPGSAVWNATTNADCTGSESAAQRCTGKNAILRVRFDSTLTTNTPTCDLFAIRVIYS